MFSDCQMGLPDRGDRASIFLLFARVFSYASILLVPVILLSRYQFIPFDDCLRHAAKAVSGRSWSDILVLREGVVLDQHPGWHAFLALLNSVLGMGKEELVLVEWTLLFVVVSIAVLPLFRRPESWIAAMLVACLAFPESFMFRLTRGRPYLLTEAFLLVLLLVWGKSERRTAGLLAVTTMLLALSVWIHGTTWYLWVLPVIALVLSGRIRDAMSFAGCWLVGSVFGAMLSGHPFDYLFQQFNLLFLSLGNRALSRMLVGEFQPFSGGLLYLLAVGFICLVRYVVSGAWLKHNAERLFVAMAVLGWLGGLYVSRLWTEWGLPACQLWLAFMIQDIMTAVTGQRSGSKVLVAAAICFGFILSATADIESRWSKGVFLPGRYGLCTNAGSSSIEKNLTNNDGWLPGPGGIIYNSQMDIFTMLFFQHPEGRWRYVHGYESGLMTDENLKVLRDIQFNFGSWPAYKPWVDKMKSADRMIVCASVQPQIPELEWLEYQKKIWIGRRHGE